MAQVRSVSGRIDVLLHAAGLEISRTLPDKQPREFDLVFDVKSDGWFNAAARGAATCRSARPSRSARSPAGSATPARPTTARRTTCCARSPASFRQHPAGHPRASRWTGPPGAGSAWRPAGSIPKIMEMAGIEMLPPEAGVAWIRRELTSGAESRRGRGRRPARRPDRGTRPDRWAGPGCGRRGGRRPARWWAPCRALGVHSGLVVRTDARPDAAAVPRRPPHRRHRRAARSDGHRGVRRGGHAARARLPGGRGGGRRLPGPGEVLPGRAADADDRRGRPPRTGRTWSPTAGCRPSDCSRAATPRRSRPTSPAGCG